LCVNRRFIGSAGDELQRVDHRLLGNRRAGISRAQQELGGVDREPGLRLRRCRPQAEATIEALAIEYEAHRLLQSRRAVRARGHFPTDEAATKLLFLVLNRSEKEWIMPPREWCMAKAQFAVLFGERFTRAMA